MVFPSVIKQRRYRPHCGIWILLLVQGKGKKKRAWFGTCHTNTVPLIDAPTAKEDITQKAFFLSQFSLVSIEMQRVTCLLVRLSGYALGRRSLSPMPIKNCHSDSEMWLKKREQVNITSQVVSLRKKPESVVTLSQLQANSYVTSLRWLGEDFSLQCSWSTKWRIISTPWFILTALWIKLAPCGFAALLNLKFISVTESDWNYVLRKRWLKSTCAAHVFTSGKRLCLSKWDDSGWKESGASVAWGTKHTHSDKSFPGKCFHVRRRKHLTEGSYGKLRKGPFSRPPCSAPTE